MSAVIPSKSLFDPDEKTQHKYVNSNNTDVAATWARFRAEHAEPTTAESYQRDALAEARARKIQGNK